MQTRYKMTKPCKRGHLGERYTKSKVCCQCDLEAQQRRREADPDWNRKRVKDWQKKNPEKHNAKSRQWYADNTEQHDKAVRNWQSQNKGKVRAIEASYRAKKLKATPKWADNQKLEQFYKDCPEGYEVDHIIPLKDKNVSGLHVQGNLQYLTPKANRAKNNSFD